MPALNLYRLNANGSVTRMNLGVARGGAWRPIYLYTLPAEASDVLAHLTASSGFGASIVAKTRKLGKLSATFGTTRTISVTGNVLGQFAGASGFKASVFADARKKGTAKASSGFKAVLSGSPVSNVGTTVVTITDLLQSGEGLGTTNDTAILQKAIDRLIFKVGTAAAITTAHVTVDFESRYWRSENPLAFPTDTAISGTYPKPGGGFYPKTLHVCQNWPAGMVWRNGGIQANTKDGMTGGVANTAVDRNRYHLRFQQAVRRPANGSAILELNNFWIKGPLTYAASDNYGSEILPREGQEAVYLSGQQWLRLVDCIIEQQYGDTIFFQERDTEPVSNRDGRVFPGQIEVFGGIFRRPGIMNMTLNTCRPPDAVYSPNWWRNDPAGKTQNGTGYVDQPSASGQQFGLWWHSNDNHPFTSIDHMRSWIDMEQQANYGYAGDVTIGSDNNRNNFTIVWPNKPEARDANTIQHFDFTMVRRFKMRHIYIDGAMNISFLGSPSGILDLNNQATEPLAASEVGGVLNGTSTTISGAATTSGFPASGRILIPTTVGHTHGRYTSVSGANWLGVTGAVGTMAAGNLRNASNKRDGCNITSGSNGVVLGAVGSSVAGTGILNVDNMANMTPTPTYVRVWTATGTATIKCGPKNGTTQFTACTVAAADSVGMVLHTGQAVTYAYNSPERIPYCTGNVELDDIYATAASQSKTLSANDCDGFKVTNCYSPYRSTNIPFSDNQNVINFNKGGSSQFGNNTFFSVDTPPTVIGTTQTAQTVVNAHPAGTFYEIAAGVHQSNFNVVPKAGDTFTGQAGAVLDGGNSLRHAFSGSAANVTIQNLTVRNYGTAATGFQEAAIQPETTAGGWIVRDVTCTGNYWAGLMCTNNMQVIRGHYNSNGQLGISGNSSTGILVDGAEIAYNQVLRADCQFEGGGFKWDRGSVTIRNCNVHHNDCRGLWSDQNAHDMLIENNTVSNNASEGITIEISQDAVIRNNVLVGNGNNYPPANNWYWNPGILASASFNIEVYGNRLSGNYNGITGVQQTRNDDTPPAHLLDHFHVYNNQICATGAGGHPTGVISDNGSNLAIRDITFSGNTIQTGPCP